MKSIQIWRTPLIILFGLLYLFLLPTNLTGNASGNLLNLDILRKLLPGSPQAGINPEKWLSYASDQSTAFPNLPAYYLNVGEKDKALSAAIEVTELAREDAVSQYWLGRAYWENGEKEQARQIWNSNGVITPMLENRVSQAYITAYSGNIDQAAADLYSVIDMNPNFGLAYDALATVLWGQQDQKAEEIIWALEQGRRVSPMDSFTWYWCDGRLHIIRGEWAEAAVSLRSAVKLNMSEWPMRFLAIALEKQGDNVGARAVLQEIQQRWGN